MHLRIPDAVQAGKEVIRWRVRLRPSSKDYPRAISGAAVTYDEAEILPGHGSVPIPVWPIRISISPNTRGGAPCQSETNIEICLRRRSPLKCGVPYQNIGVITARDDEPFSWPGPLSHKECHLVTFPCT